MGTYSELVEPNTSSAERKRIAILSDDSTLSLSLTLFFENEFDVSVVSNPADVPGLIRNDAADLLLIDTGLPNKEVSRLLGDIRSSSKHFPIVSMYVFHDRSRLIDNDIKKNSDAVFYKPANILDVLGQIRLLLSIGNESHGLSSQQ